MALRIRHTLIIAVIGDESTVTGLLLTGLGERNNKGESNFFIVEKETTTEECEEVVRGWLDRPDVGIVLISQTVAERVRNIIVEHEKAIPTILEIPSKGHPYEADKDTIVVNAAAKLWGADSGMDKLKSLQAANK
jgi:V-type H+-transporting ATPase subunit F